MIGSTILLPQTVPFLLIATVSTVTTLEGLGLKRPRLPAEDP